MAKRCQTGMRGMRSLQSFRDMSKGAIHLQMSPKPFSMGILAMPRKMLFRHPNHWGLNSPLLSPVLFTKRRLGSALGRDYVGFAELARSKEAALPCVRESVVQNHLCRLRNSVEKGGSTQCDSRCEGWKNTSGFPTLRSSHMGFPWPN
jgi:hypothetical protein